MAEDEKKSSSPGRVAHVQHRVQAGPSGNQQPTVANLIPTVGSGPTHLQQQVGPTGLPQASTVPATVEEQDSGSDSDDADCFGMLLMLSVFASSGHGQD